MTVPSATCTLTYPGNDLVTTFPFTFPIFDRTHLVVTHIASDGTETLQVESTNYTLTWLGSGRTGSVNRIQVIMGVPTPFPLPTGESLRVERIVPLTQTVDLVNNTRVRIDQMEKGLDYLTQIDQQQQNQIDLADHAGDHLPGGTGELPWTTIHGRGLAADRPTASPSNAGFLYHSYDNLTLERSDGTVWHTYAPAGTGSGTGTGWVNVMDYGAVADGVTDDTASIQAAITAANGDAAVYIPSGTYRINGQINITIDKTRVFGDGNTTWLKCSGGDKTPYAFYSTADDVVIESMDITADYGRYLVVCEGVNRNRFSNIRFVLDGSGSRIGIFVYKDSSDITINGCQFYNQSWGGVATGGDVTGNVDGPVNRVTITGCYFYQCGDEAIDINWDTHGVLITNNTIIDCGGTSNEALDIGGGTSPHECTDIQIVNNSFIYTATAGRAINVKFITLRTLIANNTFSAPATAGPTPYCIFVEGGANGVTIANNNIDGFGRGVMISGDCLFVKVIGNTIKDPWGHLIYLGLGIGRIDIEGNTLIQTAGQEDMVRFQYGIFVKFTGNKIVGRPGRNPFWINSTMQGPVLIAGNQFIGGAIQVKVDAGVYDISIYNNAFSRAEQESIYLYGGNDNIDIVGNQFHEWSATGTTYAIIDAGGAGRSISDNAFYNELTTVGDGCISFTAAVTGAIVTGNRSGATISGTAFDGFSNVVGIIANNYDDSTGEPLGGMLSASGFTSPTGRITGRTTAGTGAVEDLTPAQVRTMLAVPEIVAAPVTATDPGTPDQIAYDGSYLYVCTGSNTWKRTLLSTWVVTSGSVILTRASLNIVTRTGDTVNYR